MTVPLVSSSVDLCIYLLLFPVWVRILIGSLSVFQYVLAVGSSVFGAMFYGDLAEGQSEIQIPDVEPAAFLILLK